MIEEKLTIDFDEYRSIFHNTEKLSDEEVTENAQCSIDAINKAIDNFISGATTVEHHGFYLRCKNCKNFYAEVNAPVSSYDVDDVDLISLNISDDCGISAEYRFDISLKLVLTKQNQCVFIDCR